MARVEIVIDAPVELVTIAGRLADAEKIIESAKPTDITVAGDGNAVHDRPAHKLVKPTIFIREVVGLGHQRDRSRDQARGIRSSAVGVPEAIHSAVGAVRVRTAGWEIDRTKYTEVIQLARIRRSVRVG